MINIHCMEMAIASAQMYSLRRHNDNCTDYFNKIFKIYNMKRDILLECNDNSIFEYDFSDLYKKLQEVYRY